MRSYFVISDKVRVIANLPLAKVGVNSEVTGVVIGRLFDKVLNLCKINVKFDNPDNYLIKSDVYFVEDLEFIKNYNEYDKGYEFGSSFAKDKSEDYLVGMIDVLQNIISEMAVARCGQDEDD